MRSTGSPLQRQRVQPPAIPPAIYATQSESKRKCIQPLSPAAGLMENQPEVHYRLFRRKRRIITEKAHNWTDIDLTVLMEGLARK